MPVANTLIAAGMYIATQLVGVVTVMSEGGSFSHNDLLMENYALNARIYERDIIIPAMIIAVAITRLLSQKVSFVDEDIAA